MTLTESPRPSDTTTANDGDNEVFFTPGRIPDHVVLPSPVQAPSFARPTSSSLTREEQLAMWREQKKSEKKERKPFSTKLTPGKENTPVRRSTGKKRGMTPGTAGRRVRGASNSSSVHSVTVAQLPTSEGPRKRKASANPSKDSSTIAAASSSSHHKVAQATTPSHAKYRRVAKAPPSRNPVVTAMALQVMTQESKALSLQVAEKDQVLQESKLDLAYYKYQYNSITHDLQEAKKEISALQSTISDRESAASFEAEARRAQDLLEKAQEELREAYEQQARSESRAVNSQEELLKLLDEVSQYRSLVKGMKQQIVELEMERDDNIDALASAKENEIKLKELETEIAQERMQVAKRVRGLTEEVDALRMANEVLAQLANQVPPAVKDELERLRQERDRLEDQYDEAKRTWESRSETTAMQVNALAQRVQQASSAMARVKYLEAENAELESTVAKYRALFKKHGVAELMAGEGEEDSSSSGGGSASGSDDEAGEEEAEDANVSQESMDDA